MKVKSHWDLELSDLPLIESPFFTASHVDKLLKAPSSYAYAQDAGRQMTRQTLQTALREGHLLLVFSSVGLDKPSSPVIVWEPDSSYSSGGRWRLKGETNALRQLEQDIQALNRWKVTPETIRLSGAGGVGHLSARGLNATMTERRADERVPTQHNDSRRLTLPVGAAASVAPLASAVAPVPAYGEKVPEKKEKQKKPVHLEVGIFTDGTLNNAGNIDIFRQRVEEECLTPHQKGHIDDTECEQRLALLLGDSYANGISNVAKLGDLYPRSTDETSDLIIHRFPVYEPGAGSKTGAPDSLEGMATGLGETGVIDQVKRAFTSVAELTSQLVNDGAVDRLTLDLFGFSRGGAAARHAANEVSSGSAGELGKALAAQGIGWPNDAKVRFIGLFDTVAAILNISGGDISPSNDQNAPVNVHLKPEVADAVVQFTAIDECRENFALNSLHGTDGALPANFREIAVPGAHSDIGGGYHDSQTEQLLLSPTLSIDGSATAWPQQTMQWDNLATLKAAAEAEGWVGPESLALPSGEVASLEIHKTVREHPVPDGQVDLNLKLQRMVRGGLSQIYLHCMYDLAKSEGVPLNDIRTAKIATEIPEQLLVAHRLVSEQILQGSNRPKLPQAQTALLKQQYVHHSDHYNLFESLVGDSIIRWEFPFPTLSPFRPAPDRKRIVHANKPEA